MYLYVSDRVDAFGCKCSRQYRSCARTRRRIAAVSNVGIIYGSVSGISRRLGNVVRRVAYAAYVRNNAGRKYPCYVAVSYSQTSKEVR